MDDKPTLKELLTHVDVGVKWMTLGIHLELDMKDLQAIERASLNAVDMCIQQMYNLWLTSQPEATRRQLLKALEVMKALTLADNYKKWIASNAVKPPNTRSASASKISSKQTPQSLGITDLNEILRLLKNGLFNGSWEDLGLQLGLYKPTLNNIQADNPRGNDACLRECIAKWLQRADDVDSKGGASYVTLAEALEEMDQKNPADHIRSKKLGLQENVHLPGLRERQPQPKPAPAPLVDSSYIAEDGDYQLHGHTLQPGTKQDTQDQVHVSPELKDNNEEIVKEEEEEHRNEQLTGTESVHDHDENQRLSCEIESLKETNSVLKEKLDTTKKQFRAASQELDMLKYNKKELDEKRFSFRTKSTFAFAFLLSTFAVVLMSIVISMLIAAVSNLYSSHTPKHFIAPLPGVEVIKSTDLTVVGGQSRKFDWKEYGLLLDVPSDALPHGFLADITIRVSVSGPYIYPGLENWKPASPVYWISSSREFINPIMFGIRHYVRGEVNSSVIKVVTADDSPQNVSYVFQEIPNNITVSEDYVYFSMSHFSAFNYMINGTCPQSDDFCGTLFSRDSSKGKNMWDYNFVVYQCNLGLPYVKNKMENSSWSPEYEPTSVTFFNDSTEIELSLTIDPSMQSNWQAIAPFVPLKYCKEKLQDKQINSDMQFTLCWLGNDTSPTIPYKLSFPLKGAERPDKITIITKSIEQPSIWEKRDMIIISLILITISFCADYRIGIISMLALVFIFFSVLKLSDPAYSNFANFFSTLKLS